MALVARIYKPRDARQKKLNSQATRRYNKRHVEEIKDRRLRSTYGITSKERREKEENQAGLCACCGRSPTKKGLCVDHKHGTRFIRDLLCSKCNCVIGQFDESIERLGNAIEYLRKWQNLSRAAHPELKSA
jgi:hypothetical protein